MCELGEGLLLLRSLYKRNILIIIMKFSCSTFDLLHSLQLCSRAISGQQTLPILGNVLIEAEGRNCRITATDLEISIITHFPASIENEGSITVPVKAILNFAQYNSDPEVLLETSEGSQLKCTSAGAKTVISGESSSEYPTISSIEKDTSFSLLGSAFLDALHLVTFASARTTIRPVLSGVYMRSDQGKLVLVSTDSYRLSEMKIAVENLPEDVSCIIPVKVLEEVRSALGVQKNKKDPDGKEKGEDMQVEITLSSQQVEFTIGSTRLLSRLIDGKFPDYKQIIPQKHTTKSILPVRELTTTVRRMHYFAKEANNSLTFSLSSSGVQITTPQTQAGQDEALIQADIEGNEEKIALSSSYLLDFLSHLDDETVDICITDSMHPALFHLPGDIEFLHLIMPLRIQG